MLGRAGTRVWVVGEDVVVVVVVSVTPAVAATV